MTFYKTFAIKTPAYYRRIYLNHGSDSRVFGFLKDQDNNEKMKNEKGE